MPMAVLSITGTLLHFLSAAQYFGEPSPAADAYEVHEAASTAKVGEINVRRDNSRFGVGLELFG